MSTRKTPGDALQMALQFGQLLTVKIENMKEQHRKAAEQNETAKAAAAQKAEPEKTALARQEPVEQLGFISVAAGEGLKGLFQELGCSVVVSGGQTMNPSTEDILEAALATPAKKCLCSPTIKYHSGGGTGRFSGHRPGDHRGSHQNHSPGPFRHAGL